MFCVYSYVAMLMLKARRGGHLLEQAAVLEVVLDDDISDSIEHKLDIVGVCRTGEVSVNLLLVFPLVQVFKLHLNVSCSFLVCIGP